MGGDDLDKRMQRIEYLLGPGVAAMFAKKLQQLEDDPTDEQLIAQLKREASAITYAAETNPNEDANWKF